MWKFESLKVASNSETLRVWNFQRIPYWSLHNKQREKQKEDRKDERTKIQATQQSEMIDQRNNKKPPKNFESSGNDLLGEGFDLGAFGPS